MSNKFRDRDEENNKFWKELFGEELNQPSTEEKNKKHFKQFFPVPIDSKLLIARAISNLKFNSKIVSRDYTCDRFVVCDKSGQIIGYISNEEVDDPINSFGY
jgi:hypothetical protein